MINNEYYISLTNKSKLNLNELIRGSLQNSKSIQITYYYRINVSILFVNKMITKNMRLI